MQRYHIDFIDNEAGLIDMVLVLRALNNAIVFSEFDHSIEKHLPIEGSDKTKHRITFWRRVL